jgi:hypothetical protein
VKYNVANLSWETEERSDHYDRILSACSGLGKARLLAMAMASQSRMVEDIGPRCDSYQIEQAPLQSG